MIPAHVFCFTVNVFQLQPSSVLLSWILTNSPLTSQSKWVLAKKWTKLTPHISHDILHLLQEWSSADQDLHNCHLQLFFWLHLPPGLQTMLPYSYHEHQPSHWSTQSKGYSSPNGFSIWALVFTSTWRFSHLKLTVIKMFYWSS